MNPEDAERAVLGAVMSGWRDMDDLGLSGEDFYQPVNGQVWDACRRVAEMGQRPDPVKVRMALGDTRMPKEAAVYLVDLVGACPSHASAGYYAKIVADAADRRGLSRVADRIRQLSESDREPSTLIDDARALLDRAPQRGVIDALSWDDVSPGVIDQIEKGVSRGLATPWDDLNDAIHGLVGGRVYLVAGRPGDGKSLVGQALAVEIATRHRKAAYVASLEMSAADLGTRIYSSKGGVDIGKLMAGRPGEQDWSRISTAEGVLAGMPLFINDTPNQTMAQIRTAARNVARKHDLGVVVIDYLQLIIARDLKVNRQEQVSEISRQLKLLARELNVPVVALTQLNRASLQRPDKMPGLGDLRESGAQEQDADVVLLLHRDDESPWELTVHVGKNRHGTKPKFTLDFWGHYSRLTNPTRRTA